MSLLSPTYPAALGARLRSATSVTPALIADVIGENILRASSRHVSSPWQATRSKRVGQLICLGAWTDAALELVALELPQWNVRRLAYDGGEWHCALSRERELPDWLDQAAEGRHTELPLAILSALTEARRMAADAQETATPRAPQAANMLFEPLLSDNFA